jgi:hypothetical protein
MNRVIVNFADEAGWYRRGQQRLHKVLERFSPGDAKLFYQDYGSVGSPEHADVPYAFKPYCLWNAMVVNYDMAIYCDASVYPIKSMEPIWQLIERDGVFMEQLEAKHNLGVWSSDACLANLGIEREEAFNIPCLIAGCIGFNFKNTRALELLRQWLKLANDGQTFKGAWVNTANQVSADYRVLGHRHDQSALSGLVWRQKWPVHPFRTYIAYVNNEPQADTVIFNVNPA